MLNSFSKYIVKLLSSIGNMSIDDETYEVYVYGIECILNNGLIILILGIVSYLTDSIIYTFIWLCSFVILRHNAGGYHASTHMGCVASSSVIGISNIYIVKVFCPLAKYAILAFIFSFVVSLFLAPIQTTKQILSKKQRILYKIKALAIIVIGYSVSIITPPPITVSIAYAFLICSILMIIAKINTYTDKLTHLT